MAVVSHLPAAGRGMHQQTVNVTEVLFLVSLQKTNTPNPALGKKSTFHFSKRKKKNKNPESYFNKFQKDVCNVS